MHLEDCLRQRTAGEEEQERRQQALNQAHAALLAANDELHAMRENVTAIQNRIDAGRETAERLKNEGDSLQNRLKLIEATLNQSDGGMGEAEKLRQQAAEALEIRRSAQAAISEKTGALEEELNRHQAEWMERMNRMQSMRTNQARQAAMQQQMEQRKAELESQRDTEQRREAELNAAMEEAKASLQSEEQRLNELRQSAETLDQSSKQLLQDILTRQRQMQEDAQNARAADTRLRTLKELQDGYEGYQYSVKNALSYAKKQQLSGVRGVVAMLLRVPKEYETAMDMALGGAMQNIVTETEQDAKRLIEYLRQNRLGRATFLPLSTVHGRTLNPNERRVLNMPGCVGVAS